MQADCNLNLTSYNLNLFGFSTNPGWKALNSLSLSKGTRRGGGSPSFLNSVSTAWSACSHVWTFLIPPYLSSLSHFRSYSWIRYLVKAGTEQNKYLKSLFAEKSLVFRQRSNGFLQKFRVDWLWKEKGNSRCCRRKLFDNKKWSMGQNMQKFSYPPHGDYRKVCFRNRNVWDYLASSDLCDLWFNSSLHDPLLFRNSWQKQEHFAVFESAWYLVRAVNK